MRSPTPSLVRITRQLCACAALLAVALLLAAPAARAAPVPHITVTPPSGTYAGDVVDFDASATVAAPDATYSWDIAGGDPQGYGGLTAMTTYHAAGTYTVTLTVTDATGTNQAQAFVTVSYRHPLATFAQGTADHDCWSSGSDTPGICSTRRSKHWSASSASQSPEG